MVRETEDAGRKELRLRPDALLVNGELDGVDHRHAVVPDEEERLRERVVSDVELILHARRIGPRNDSGERLPGLGTRVPADHVVVRGGRRAGRFEGFVEAGLHVVHDSLGREEGFFFRPGGESERRGRHRRKQETQDAAESREALHARRLIIPTTLT